MVGNSHKNICTTIIHNRRLIVVVTLKDKNNPFRDKYTCTCILCIKKTSNETY